MKKIILLGAILCCALFTAKADTTNLTTLDRVFATVGGMTNYAVEPYLTYADKAPTKFGGGVLTVYNVSQNVGLGMGVDWLGQLSLITANVTLSAPFHPLPQQLPSVILCPFVLAGVGTASSGGGNFNGAVSTVEDVGAYIKFGHAFGGSFNVGACYGQWTGVGPYDVKREHLFLGWSHGF
ncbi:MAG: hypothetical protein KGL39_10250 [Patescibacteria group bacterium]|nr:hypothetical protein [Patescibacteria group bacterium]